MDILLINLPREGEIINNTTPKYFLYDFMNYPPLGLLAIAASVDKKHQLQVLDTITKNMTIDDIVKYIENQKPDVLGISVVTWRLFALYDIARKVKEIIPDIKIIAGGPHVNYYPTETIKLGVIDYALTGFCENKFPLLIEAIDKTNKSILQSIKGLYYRIDGEIYIKSDNNEKVDLDEMPFPNRSLINIDDYFTLADKTRMTTVYTSRGCPFKCVFCDVGIKNYYYRSAKKIVDEFDDILKKNINEIHVFDDTFNINRQRVIDMCKEIIKRKLNVRWSARARVYPCDEEMISIMKQAGCIRLHVGIETLDPEILKYIKKKITLEQIHNFFKLCNKYKIDTLAYFMVGFPLETKEYLKKLYREIKKLRPTYIYFNILQPLAGTEFYEHLLKEERYKYDFWQDFIEKPVHNFKIPTFRSEKEDRNLISFVDHIHKKFYLSPYFILKDLQRTSSLRLLQLKIRAAFKMLFNFYN